MSVTRTVPRRGAAAAVALAALALAACGGTGCTKHEQQATASNVSAQPSV